MKGDLADPRTEGHSGQGFGVHRNLKRFPSDFVFELTNEENRSLRSQNVILERGRYSKYLPFAFTEQGVAMLSSVLTSERAIEVNIAIMRVFVRLREMMATHKELALKLRELEGRIQDHDEQIKENLPLQPFILKVAKKMVSWTPWLLAAQRPKQGIIKRGGQKWGSQVALRSIQR